MIRLFPGPFVLLFVIAGIMLGDITHASSWLFLFLSILSFVIGIYSAYRRRLKAATMALAVCIGSAAGFEFSSGTYDLGPHHVARIIREPQVYQVFGKVSDWPDIRSTYTDVRIELDSIRGDFGRKVTGAILLKVTDTTTALQRGDAVEFVGRIYPLKGSDDSRGDYQRRLALRGIFGTAYLPTLLDVRVDRRSSYGLVHQADRLRESIKESLQRNLSVESAALACGFLIGETRDIPAEIYTRFRDTGTLHLLAISGSNVALLLLVVSVLLRPFGTSRVTRSILLLAVVLVFSLICYGEPSVIRASLMATLVILARLVGRRYDLNNIIGLTALLILLVQPGQLFDVGFQLSFATAWGLIFIVPKVAPLLGSFVGNPSRQVDNADPQGMSRYRLLFRSRWLSWTLLSLVVSFVAQVSSAPIIIYYFRAIPLISPLANLLVVPMVSLSVIGLQLILVANLIWPTLGLFIGSLVDPLIRATLRVANAMGEQQWGVVRLESHADRLIELFAVFCALALPALLALAISNKRFRRISVIAFCVMLNAGLFVAAESVVKGSAPFVHIASVPGGVLATVSTAAGEPADCILTGLVGKEYPVDQRVLLPILSERKVTDLGRLFVLSVSYDAVDELFNLSERLRVDTLYIRSELRPMIEDALAADSTRREQTLSVCYFGDRSESTQHAGYYLSNSAIRLHTAGRDFQFVSKIGSHEFPPVEGRGAVMVIGGPWQPSATDWLDARKAGYDLVVCSRIIQYHPPNIDRNDPYPDRVAPDYVYDLDRRGNLTLPYSE